MNKLTKFFLSCIALLACVSLAACSDDEPTTGSNQVQGIWEGDNLSILISGDCFILQDTPASVFNGFKGASYDVLIDKFSNNGMAHIRTFFYDSKNGYYISYQFAQSNPEDHNNDKYYPDPKFFKVSIEKDILTLIELYFDNWSDYPQFSESDGIDQWRDRIILLSRIKKDPIYRECPTDAKLIVYSDLCKIF